MTKYDIVMLSAGEAALTKACVASVVRNSHDYRLIWIDNEAGEGGTCLWGDFDEDARQRIDYYQMPENLGFTKAANAGLAISTAPRVVILNDDTEVPEGWLDKLDEGFEQINRLAAIGPLSTSPRQWQGAYKGGNGVQAIAPRLSLRGSAIGGPMLAFFCTMISREAIEAIGYLDERFSPGFGEDDDWCARAYLQGWQLAIHTGLRVKHVHRATWKSDKALTDYQTLQRRNATRLREKYQGIIDG